MGRIRAYRKIGRDLTAMGVNGIWQIQVIDDIADLVILHLNSLP